MRTLVSLMLCCLRLNLGILPGCQGDGRAVQLTTDQPQVKINVGKNATLVWRYKIESNINYNMVWGISDGNDLKSNGILFSQDSHEKRPRMSSVPTAYAGRVHIVDQASLVITNARLSDEGFYTCEIRLLFTTLRKTIELRVVDPPRITQHPTAALVISEGESHSLTCQASGKPIPDVKWIKNTKLVGPIRKGQADINFNPVSDRDAGSYKCVATNSGGRDEDFTNVTVLFKPKDTRVTTDASNNTVGQGGTLTLSCIARGYPKPKYKFYRKTSSGQKKAINDPEATKSGRLKFDVISHNQAGVYICEPENTKGRGLPHEVHVQVKYPPRITQRPKDVSIKELKGLTVSCKASGYPVPKITWVKHSDNRRVGQGESLLFHSVRREDSGVYKCVADNGEGKPAATYLRIDVKYAPRINKTLTKDRVAGFRDQIVVLHCVADGNPAPKYHWTKPSGEKLPVRERNGTISITLSGDKPFGLYLCLVDNAYGHDTTAVRVEEVVQPYPVLHFTDQGATPNSVSLRWTPPGRFGNSKIVEYVLQYSENEKVWRTLIIKPEETSYVVTGLLAYTEYTFKIKVANEYFTSDAVTLKKRTTEAAPGAPENFAIYVINSTAVRLSWSEPKRPNGRIVRYQITYRIVTTIPQYPDRVSTPHNVTSYTLGGLKPFTNYSIDVMASNEIPGGNKSVLFITTLQQAPGIPRDLSFNYTGGQVIQLTWRRPRVLNGVVVGLRVKLEWWRNDTLQSHSDVVEERAVGRKARAKRATSRDGHEIVVEQVKPWRSVVVKNLMFFSMYRLSVSEGTGSERVLWGPYTNVTRAILTPEGAPSKPVNVKISQVTISSLGVAWHRPLFPNGKIRMYTVKYWNNSNVFTEKLSRDLNNQSFLIVLSHLKPLTPYKVTVQAFTLYPGQKSDVMQAKTEKTGSTSAQTGGIDSASLLGGVSTGVVLLGFLIIGLVILYRNRRKKRDSTELQKGRYAVANSNDSGIGEKDSMEGGMRYLHTTPRRSSEDASDPGGFKKRKPIPVNKLKEYCDMNHSDHNKRFKEEFLSIRASGNFSWDHSHRPENKSKNRYTNIVAYDQSRVALTDKDSILGSDYINANYIDGYNQKCRFIATQGPVASTFDDFWRMVWEQGSSMIVMVTNVVERGRVKCLKYWPSSDPEVYGSIIVTPTEEDELADYTIRKFTIQMTSGTVEFPRREITQYHFTAWPDHGVPSHATSLLSFIRHIRRSLSDDVGPVVCHCSAGVGRTGTFIVLDAMLAQMMTEGVVDVYGFVTHIRQQRNQMVQTEAQYIFIHDALLEAAMCGDTEIKVQNLQDKLKMLNSVDPATEHSYLQAEFRNLDLAVNERDTFLSASIPENKNKNRFAILPYDSTRVKLWPYPGIIGSDYINANFIDSYQQREAFIATQAPLEHTCVDFWRMIWEYESYTVVMLTMPFESNEYAVYLPKKEEFSVHGLLMVEIDSEEVRNGYVKRQLKVTNSKTGASRTLYHFHYVDWPENSVARSQSGLIDMMKYITKSQQVSGNGPITVHCSDGSGRTGTFCAISTAIERVKLEGTVDMFQIVRKLRGQRPLMVQTMDQYRFCYDVVNEFVELYSDYANFK